MPSDAPFISDQAQGARRFAYGVHVGDEVMNYPLNTLPTVGLAVFLSWQALWPSGGLPWFQSVPWRVLTGLSALFWVLICVGIPSWFWLRGIGLKRFDFTIGDGVLRMHRIPDRKYIPLAKCTVKAGWRGTRIEYKGNLGPATDERIFVPRAVASRAEIESLVLPHQ
jgi:hypothetical protein